MAGQRVGSCPRGRSGARGSSSGLLLLDIASPPHSRGATCRSPRHPRAAGVGPRGPRPACSGREAADNARHPPRGESSVWRRTAGGLRAADGHPGRGAERAAVDASRPPRWETHGAARARTFKGRPPRSIRCSAAGPPRPHPQETPAAEDVEEPAPTSSGRHRDDQQPPRRETTRPQADGVGTEESSRRDSRLSHSSAQAYARRQLDRRGSTRRGFRVVGGCRSSPSPGRHTDTCPTP